MMWAYANQIVKRWFPAFHTCLKLGASSQFAQRVGVSVPRRMGGRWIWTAAHLVGAPPPEEHILYWVSQVLPPGGTFYDVGAHYGWISLIAAHRVGSSGHVIAFEPAPALSELVTYHKRINRLPQIELVSKAVCDVNAEHVPFFLLNKGMSFRNSLTIGADDAPYVTAGEKMRYEVTAITLDRFVECTKLIPHLIKIDVEGAELLVLRGAEELLRCFRPYLIVGVHPFWMPRFQKVAEIFDLLKKFGYEITDKRVVQFEGGYYADYLCVPGRTNQ